MALLFDQIIAGQGLEVLLGGDRYRIVSLNTQGVVVQGIDRRRPIRFGDLVMTLGGRQGVLACPQSRSAAEDSVKDDWVLYFKAVLARIDGGWTPEQVDQLRRGVGVLVHGGLDTNLDVDDVLWHGANVGWPVPRGAWRSSQIRSWQTIGRSLEELRYAIAAGFDPEDLADWLELRHAHNGALVELSDCRDWRRYVGGVTVARDWIALGVSPSIWLRLSARGLTQDRFAELLQIVPEIEQALLLVEHGLPSNSSLEAWMREGRSARDLINWRIAGFEPLQALEWIRHGVTDPKLAGHWKRKKIAPDRLVAFGADVDFEFLADDGWVKSAFSPEEARSWIFEGIKSAATAVSWHQRGFNAVDARRWIDLGVVEPLNARVWHDTGYRPDGLGGVQSDPVVLSSLGEVAIEDVRDWMVANFAPSEALLWAATGISLERASNFRDRGLSASRVCPLVGAGFSDLEVVDWTLDLPRWDPDQVIRLRAACVEPTTVAHWSSCGFKLSSIPEWLASSLSPENARQWYLDGWDSQSAQILDDAQIPLNVARVWRKAGMTATSTVDWLAVGVDVPRIAQIMGADGAPEDVRFCERAGLSIADIREIVLGASQFQVSGIMGKLRALSPHYGLWRAAVPDKKKWIFLAVLCDYNVDTAARMVRYPQVKIEPSLMALSKLLRHDADNFFRILNLGVPFRAICDGIAAGETVDSIHAAHLRKTQPVVKSPKVGAASIGTLIQPLKKPEKQPVKGDEIKNLRLKWLSPGIRQIDHLGLARDGGPSELFDWLRESGWKWATPSTMRFDWFDSRSTDWLFECQSRALSSRGLMRKLVEGVKVIEIDGDDLLVAVQLLDEIVVAWVGDAARKVGILVGFREDDFASLMPPSDRACEIAVGLAISWYVDCAVTLVSKTSRFTHSFEESERKRHDRSADLVRYVPTSRYVSDVKSIRQGRDIVPRGSWVQAHVRRLRPGWNPNPEHVARAPRPLRRIMGPSDTWVSAHAKKGADASEVINRLSRHSALADAMGLAAR
jgi:hypothetical protein